jgi:hypothetical protein
MVVQVMNRLFLLFALGMVLFFLCDIQASASAPGHGEWGDAEFVQSDNAIPPIDGWQPLLMPFNGPSDGPSPTTFLVSIQTIGYRKA